MVLVYPEMSAVESVISGISGDLMAPLISFYLCSLLIILYAHKWNHQHDKKQRIKNSIGYDS
jgi:hypothetical protein